MFSISIHYILLEEGLFPAIVLFRDHAELFKNIKLDEKLHSITYKHVMIRKI